MHTYTHTCMHAFAEYVGTIDEGVTYDVPEGTWLSKQGYSECACMYVCIYVSYDVRTWGDMHIEIHITFMHTPIVTCIHTHVITYRMHTHAEGQKLYSLFLCRSGK